MKPESGKQFTLKSVLLVVTTVAVLSALLGNFLERERRHRVQSAERRSLETAHQLAGAFEAYIVRYGWLPPSSCDNCVNVHLVWLCPQSTFEDKDVHRLLAMDDSECLVFWLRGDYYQMIGKQSWGVFDFDPNYLVDTDNDGFQEYTARDGNPFCYRDGRVFVKCTATGRDIIVDVDDSQVSVTLEELTRLKQDAGGMR